MTSHSAHFDKQQHCILFLGDHQRNKRCEGLSWQRDPHHSGGLGTQGKKHGDCGPWIPFPPQTQLKILTWDVLLSWGNEIEQCGLSEYQFNPQESL